jgi:hypothetical protein
MSIFCRSSAGAVRNTCPHVRPHRGHPRTIIITPLTCAEAAPRTRGVFALSIARHTIARKLIAETYSPSPNTSREPSPSPTTRRARWLMTVHARCANGLYFTGDLIFDCPVACGRGCAFYVAGQRTSDLESAIQGRARRCRRYDPKLRLGTWESDGRGALPALRAVHLQGNLEEKERARGQTPTLKAWRQLCDDIRDGYVWNLKHAGVRKARGHGARKTNRRFS